MPETTAHQPGGVSVDELRAAVAAARPGGECDGVVWSAAEWERVWLTLTPRQQSVVYLHILVGLTHTDVARELAVSRGTVDGTWRRAVERIRLAAPRPN